MTHEAFNPAHRAQMARVARAQRDPDLSVRKERERLKAMVTEQLRREVKAA